MVTLNPFTIHEFYTEAKLFEIGRNKSIVTSIHFVAYIDQNNKMRK